MHEFCFKYIFIFLGNFHEGIMIVDELKIAYQKYFTFVHFLEINLGGEGDIKKIISSDAKNYIESVRCSIEHLFAWLPGSELTFQKIIDGNTTEGRLPKYFQGTCL